MSDSLRAGRELDEACARAMGWETEKRRPGEEEARFRHAETFGLWLYAPAFSTDPAAARLLEDEIERRGLEEAYARALMKLIYDVGFKNYTHSQFLLAHATPEQRARAFLEAMKGADSE